MYRVTIELFDEEEGNKTVICHDEDFSNCVSEAIKMMREPREDLIACEIMESILNDENPSDEDFFPGQSEALLQLLENCRKIMKGWADHDEERDKKIT